MLDKYKSSIVKVKPGLLLIIEQKVEIKFVAPVITNALDVRRFCQCLGCNTFRILVVYVGSILIVSENAFIAGFLSARFSKRSPLLNKNFAFSAPLAALNPLSKYISDCL